MSCKIRMCGLACLLGFLALNRFAFAPQVGGTPDLFLQDKSPRAVESRRLRALAEKEFGLLNSLPPGVSMEQQRQRTVDAFEAAVAAMPEAPMASDLLIKVAMLWNSAFDLEEKPDKAAEVYARVIGQYPKKPRTVLQSMAGQVYCYQLEKNWAKAVERGKEMISYRLPEDADASLRAYANTMKLSMDNTIKGCHAKLLGVTYVDGQFGKSDLSRIETELQKNLVLKPREPRAPSMNSPELAHKTAPPPANPEHSSKQEAPAVSTLRPASGGIARHWVWGAALLAVAIAAGGLALRVRSRH